MQNAFELAGLPILFSLIIFSNSAVYISYTIYSLVYDSSLTVSFSWLCSFNDLKVGHFIATSLRDVVGFPLVT